MKKRLFILLLISVFSFGISAQPGGSYDFLHKKYKVEIGTDNPLNVTTYVLDNGLTVYLNPDPNLSKVFGAVVVRGGSKRDPKGDDGIAHYFEHIMFKGTEDLGTSDYPKEKVYLDSIRLMYDKLGETKEEEKRIAIQKKINDLSIKAGKYAIPNELNKVLESMGGSGINAFTNKDAIVYHNSFPGNQMEKWLEVYSHRFEKPVYRLFQSELETVYEEKNMHMDDPFSTLLETYEANMYKGHPYANTVLGEVENLKNPSLSKMDEYFKTYYVANNMALILSGDFDAQEALPIIKEKFGKWRSGEVPPMPDYDVKPLNGKVNISKRLTPVRIGLLGYRTFAKGSPDETALSFFNNLLTNQSSTGLLDKLVVDNKIMAAFAMPLTYTMMGSDMIIYVPKLIGQSFDKAENLVALEIEKIKSGDFDDELFEAVKAELLVEAQRSLESGYSRSFLILDAFLSHRTWDDILSDIDKINSLTKDDIIKVANKYFGDNYLSFHSKMGFPKKEKLEKPPFEPIEAVNSEKVSEYAEKVMNMHIKESLPKFIEFNQDVYFDDVNDLTHYYFTPNPINDVFTLKLVFGVGTEEIPMLAQVAEHISLLGTTTKSFEEFTRSMQLLGSSYSNYASGDYFTIEISGLDKNFEKTIGLMSTFLDSLKPDDKKIKQLVQNAKMNIKFEKKDPKTIGKALKEYVLYGDKSSFKDRLSVKQIKKLKSQQLINAFKKVQNYELDIHYVGKLPQKKAERLVLNNLLAVKPSIKTKSPVYKEKNKINENIVYYLNDKKAVQSQIHLLVEGKVNSRSERVIATTFNKYFSSDMSSIVFQEVREFRSLAYTAYAYHRSPFYKDKEGYTFGYMSTQADKTLDALDVFSGLFTDMPKKPQRIEHVRNSIIQSLSSDRPSFRYMSNTVSYWRKKGYKQDPRKYSLDIYKRMTFDDIEDFYNKNIYNRPLNYVIVGDKKRVNPENLTKFGRIVKVKLKDIFTE